MTSKPRILLIGATGYIGGSVLTKLIDRNGDERYEISALVRKKYQALILKDAGVTPILFESLDDFEVIRESARDHDVVIACADARHEGCAKACIFGLALRKAEKGTDVYYIHTSGTSNLCDFPITGTRIDTKTYSDLHDDIYSIERDWPEEYGPVRKIDQFVVNLGLAEEVKTYIIAPPLIFGEGTGSFTLGLGQIQMILKSGLDLKPPQAVVLGSGSGIWSRIHILDLTHLYALLLDSILSPQFSLSPSTHPPSPTPTPTPTTLPHGKNGFYFAENGSQTWKSLSERIGMNGKGLGVFKTEEVTEISLEDVAKEWTSGDLRHAESVLGSNSRTKADKAREVLGWSPEYGEEEFWNEVDEAVVSMVLEFSNKA